MKNIPPPYAEHRVKQVANRNLHLRFHMMNVELEKKCIIHILGLEKFVI